MTLIIKLLGCMLLVILLSACKSESCNYIEDYYPKVYTGILEYERGNHEAAEHILASAFSSCPPRNTRTFNEIKVLAELSAKSSNFDLCNRMLELLLEDGFTISSFTENTIYQSFFKSKVGSKLLDRSDSLSERFYKTCDTELVQVLHEMMIDDQKMRGDPGQEQFDDINEKKLIWIFENDKYPKESLSRCSSSSVSDIHTILLHTDDSIRINYFLPRIKELISDGKCDPYTYATLYDQFLRYNNQPQIFGTYKKRDRTLSTHIDKQSINVNRQNIGMPSLEFQDELHLLKIINYPESYGKFYR